MRKTIVWEACLITVLGVSLTLPWYAKADWNRYVYIVLAWVAFVPVARSAINALVKKKISIDLLASVALGFSFVAGEWYSAVFISLMLAFARLFDVWTDQKAKDTISKMMKYLPEIVRIKKGEEMTEVKLAEVKAGDLVIVEAGERVPVDGTVISGQASVNESTLTGESDLVLKKPGETVYSSTLNENGSLIVRADKVGSDSRLQQMAALVEEASRKKAKSEMAADKFAQWYVISMLAFSVVGYFLIADKNMVLAILLVVCADDIAVAVPLTFTMAIARGANLGMIIKGSSVIEKMANIKYVVTDKTGTLTMGKPKVVMVKEWTKMAKKTWLGRLGMTASASNHPVSRIITEYVRKHGEDILVPDEANETPGEGTEIKIKGEVWRLGKPEYCEKLGVEITEDQKSFLEEAAVLGYGTSVLCRGKKVAAIVELEDAIKPDARAAIGKTRKLGVEKWWMLTGDNNRVAARVSREVGIDEFKAGLTPEKKLEWIEKIKKDDPGTVAMIGDGVNDAAALALGDVSVAMGAIGSDAAIEAADIALVKDNLGKIPQAMLLGRQTLAIMKQEFVIWGITNTVGLVLVLTGYLDPAWAAAYNFLTDFFPIGNALRLGMWNPKRV